MYVTKHRRSERPFVPHVNLNWCLPQTSRGSSAFCNCDCLLRCVSLATASHRRHPCFYCLGGWEDAGLSTNLNKTSMKQRWAWTVICTCAAHPSARVIRQVWNPPPPLQTFRTLWKSRWLLLSAAEQLHWSLWAKARWKPPLPPRHALHQVATFLFLKMYLFIYQSDRNDRTYGTEAVLRGHMEMGKRNSPHLACRLRCWRWGRG